MVNFSPKRNNLITPERAAILLPSIISSLIAFILFTTFSIPKYVSSNMVKNELKQFKIKVSKLPDLQKQSRIISEKLVKLNSQKSKIIELISGTTNLETFISRLGYIGNKNNIEFNSIKPISSIKFVEAENSQIQDELNINPDELLVEGVKKYNLDLDLNAKYLDLLSFLKELELQENIILFEDFTLEKIETNEEIKSQDEIKDLKVNLKIVVYGKI